MKKIIFKIGIALIVICVLFVSFLYFNNDIGVSPSRLEKDIRNAQQIADDWSVVGEVSDTMAAYISYPADQSDHTFSVYVNRSGLSFGYFFRIGGSLSIVESKIVKFTLDEYNEAAFISLNQQKTARIEIDNGNAVEVIEIDSNNPFAIVLPGNAGVITCYDIDGNMVEPWEHPM